MDTITAISTPLGEGGIGIVRISGPHALTIADKIFVGKIKPSKAPTHTIHHGKIVEKESKSLKVIESKSHPKTKTQKPKTKKAIDEVLLMVMKKPHTYTCEDMVEINAHGGTVVLTKILELVLRSGARLAEPGEFTRRAFLAGRIDLAQAEAVLDVVQAKTGKALESAMSQLDGRLSQKIKEIKEKLVEIDARIEAGIDFPDDVPESDIVVAIHELPALSKEINELIKSGEQGRLIREGAVVPILGRTNVGKSSLFNALLNKNRAIVTPYPGTTRDTIDEWISFDGIPIKLVDTAGIRAPKNPIEKEGVKRTRQAMEEAFCALFVFDRSEGVKREDIELLDEVRANLPSEKIIGILNKCDLPVGVDLLNPKDRSEERGATSENFNSQFSILNSQFYLLLSVSALRGDNIDLIPPAIAKLVALSNTMPLVVRARHIDALRKAGKSIDRATSLVGAGSPQDPVEQMKSAPTELISYEIREAINALGEITGEVTSEDILDRIFSEFCIGK